jgi:hypothetical protein
MCTTTVDRDALDLNLNTPCNPFDQMEEDQDEQEENKQQEVAGETADEDYVNVPANK